MMTVTADDLIDATLLGERCLVEPARVESEGGLVLPDTARTEQMWGTVLNAGPGEPGFADGDTVIFQRWAGAHFERPDRSDLVLVRHKDVLVVISDA